MLFRSNYWLHAVAMAAISAGLAFTVRTVEAESPTEAATKQAFDNLLQKHENMTAEKFAQSLTQREYVKDLGFDPTEAQYFDRVNKRLQLNEEELALFKKNGFVSVDHDQPYSMGSAYYSIYTADLPVFITTDSILHAMHRSYDHILMEMEVKMMAPKLKAMLREAHQELATADANNQIKSLEKNYQDVDLYLTVARNLLEGAGAEKHAEKMDKWNDTWTGKILVDSMLGRNDEAMELLQKVKKLELQVPFQDAPTAIYGGERYMDFSQFKPRGHYNKSVALSRYFRSMMWLGRADCGFTMLPPDPQSMQQADDKRELRNAVLVAELLRATGGTEDLKSMDEVIDFMVGQSDNLTVFNLLDLMKQTKLEGLASLTADKEVAKLQKTLEESDLAEQMIRSQVLFSDENSYQKVSPPSLFQIFGQRYIIDSFVLSQVVYDSIRFDGKKVKRMMPTGVDAFVALGNDEAAWLQMEELKEFPYAANLQATREFVELHDEKFWDKNLYNIWLDTLRMLDDNHSEKANFPTAMKTKAWQLKQLQTQLASWSQLRHDTVLYAKQSYTAVPGCEYPAGYVEPYPEVYGNIADFATTAAKLIDECRLNGDGKLDRQVTFLKSMAATNNKLKTLANKELAAKPFTDEEKLWLKKTIDMRSRGSGGPRYDGWYCKLFYGSPYKSFGKTSSEWAPEIVDVHTNPESREVLEVGTGSANFLVVAVDNEGDKMTFVGPSFSYYEFHHPANDRLTDEKWSTMLRSNPPTRPDWVKAFQGPKQKRDR